MPAKLPPEIASRCISCGGPLTDDNRVRGGKSRTCKPCANAKARAKYAANPEAVREQKRRLVGANGTQRERRIAYMRAYYRAHREKLLASLHARRAANPGRQQFWNQKWFNEHPEYPAEANRRRRALLAGNEASLTREEWHEVLEFFGHACAYCLRRDVELTQDHVIALSRGGSHAVDNVVPACGSCNSAKHNKPVWAMVAAPWRQPWRQRA